MSMFLYAGGYGLLAILLVIAASLGLHEFSTKTNWVVSLGSAPPYTGKNFIGVLFFVTCTTLGASFLTIALRALVPLYVQSRVAKGVAAPSRRGRLPVFLFTHITLFVVFTTVAAVGGTWAQKIWRCGVVGCTMEATKHYTPIAGTHLLGEGFKSVTGTNAMLAGLIFAVAVLVTIFAEVRAVNAASNRFSDVDANTMDKDAANNGGFDTTPRSALSRFGTPAVLLVATLFFFFISSVLPNRWMFFSTAMLPGYIATSDMATTELIGAWFVSTAHKWGENYYVKLYPSNLFFYVYLLILIASLFVIRVLQRRASNVLGTRLLKGRRLEGPISKYLATWTVGEVLLSLLTLLMMVLFFLYWVQSHWFDKTKTTTVNERVARSLGQLAVVTVGLLLLPASRNSVLYKALGLSWEATLWMHRALGSMMLLATIAHATAWFVMYRAKGLTASDFLGPMPLQSPIDNDNWSVPLISILCIFVLTPMALTAMPIVRRRLFELFYYVHIGAAYMLIPGILYHSSASWMYMLPGLTVWIMDRAIRYFRSASPAELVSARVVGEVAENGVGEVTELRFKLPFCGSIQPGQYVFVNVPEVSLLQWHPFTVSSYVDGVASVHIKGMGTGTWTAQVAAAARVHDNRPSLNTNATVSDEGGVPLMGNGDVPHKDHNSHSLVVYVDGPYGAGTEIDAYEQIILVAGGIGITPCAGIVAAVRQARLERPPFVSLLWTVRNTADAAAVAPVFALQTGSRSHERQLSVHCSGNVDEVRRAISGSDGLSVVRGRPDISATVSALVASIPPERTLVFVCGPPTMVEDALAAASEHGCHFHTETFAL